MSQEAWEILRKMKPEGAELNLALQCAPLITGLKVSNLLSIPWNEYPSLMDILKDSWISVFFIGEIEGRGLFLLYHAEKLEAFLSQEKVVSMLEQMGYTEFSLNDILLKFRLRYQKYKRQKEDFPHEMGLLLGYPVEDVEGFIRHNGKDSLYTGYWKVYQDTETKQKIFQKFEYAKENLILLLSYQMGMKDIIDICM